MKKMKHGEKKYRLTGITKSWQFLWLLINNHKYSNPKTITIKTKDFFEGK
jgi:hypothetical protein